MKHLRRIIALFIIAAMCTSVCFAAEVVSYVPGSTDNTLAASGAGTVQDGKLYIRNWVPVSFDIPDDIIYGNTNQNVVEVEITYLDDFSGIFWLNFVDLNGVKQKAGTDITSEGTGEYVTKTFTLYHGAMQNNAIYHEGIRGDFAITYENADNSSSGDTLCVSSVNATVTDVTTPIMVSVTTENVGNIFFDGDYKGFDIKLENTTEDLAARDFLFEVLDHEKSVSYGNHQRSYTVGAGQTVTDRVALSFGRYGAFYLRVSMLDDDGSAVISWDTPFSICVKNDTLSYDVGINGGIFEDVDVHVKAMDIMKNTGFGNLRTGYDWEEFQTSATGYNIPKDSQKIIDKAHSLGMDILLTHKGNNSILFGSAGTHMPRTDEQRKAFAEYVYQSLVKTQGKVNAIEIWNEPDLLYHSANDETLVSPEIYAKLMRAVYERVKPDFPDVTICGICTCEVGNWYVEKWSRKVFNVDTDDDGEADGYKWFDRISAHHYSKLWDDANDPKDCHNTMDDIDLYKYNANDLFGINTQFYHTEFGISTTTDVSYSKQVDRLSQYLLSLRARHMGDKFFIYQFSNAGNSPLMKEANFGLTETGWSDVPYAAKPALMAVSNMNNLLCGYDNVEIVHEADSSNNSYVYKFTDDDTGRVVYSLYSPETYTYNFKPAENDVIFYDVYGNYLNFNKDSSGSYMLNLTTRPIYAVSDASLDAVDNTANGVFISDSDVSVSYTDEGDGITSAVVRFPDALEGDAVGVKVMDEDGKIVQVQQLYTDSDGKITVFFPEEEGKDYSLWFGTSGINGVYITGRNGTDGAVVFVSTAAREVLTTLDEVSVKSKIRVNANANPRRSPDFKIFCAAYKDNSIVNVDVFDIENMSCDEDVNLFYKDIDSAVFSGADSMRIFLWKSDSSIIPLTGKLELN